MSVDRFASQDLVPPRQRLPELRIEDPRQPRAILPPEHEAQAQLTKITFAAHACS